MTRQTWTLRLTRTAEADFEDILAWTVEHFGVRQARAYATTMSRAMQALAAGPDIVGAQRREDLGRGLATLHIARGRRKGRHFLVFRTRTPNAIEILRILHDSMDLARHITPTKEE